MPSLKAAIALRLSGVQELQHALLELPREPANRAVRKSLSKAARIIAKQARANARAIKNVPTAESTGALARSVGVVIKTSRRQNFTYAVIGPRRRYVENFNAAERTRTATRGGKPGKTFRASVVPTSLKRGPTRYAHLVEFGTRRTRSHPFLRAAMHAKKAEALASIRSTIGPNIDLEALRLRSRGRR